MYLGRIVELAPTRRLFARAAAPVHADAARGGARSGDDGQAADRGRGRGAESARSAGRLRVPSALPVRERALPAEAPTAPGAGRRRGRLPRGRGGRLRARHADAAGRAQPRRPVRVATHGGVRRTTRFGYNFSFCRRSDRPRAPGAPDRRSAPRAQLTRPPGSLAPHPDQARRVQVVRRSHGHRHARPARRHRRARTAAASPTSSTPCAGCSASRRLPRCAASRCRT